LLLPPEGRAVELPRGVEPRRVPVGAGDAEHEGLLPLLGTWTLRVDRKRALLDLMQGLEDGPQSGTHGTESVHPTGAKTLS
jgi:hypothetical protein